MGIEELKGKFVVDENVLDVEPKSPNFEKNLNLKFAGRHRGSIRLSTGRYYTAKEWGKRKERLVRLTLP